MLSELLLLNTAHVVVLAGRLLLAVDVDGQDGVTSAAVVIHVVSPYRPILETLLTMVNEFISLYPSFHDLTSSTATRSSSSPHSMLNRLSTTKARERLFHLTVRLDRLAPGFNKSITLKMFISLTFFTHTFKPSRYISPSMMPWWRRLRHFSEPQVAQTSKWRIWTQGRDPCSWLSGWPFAKKIEMKSWKSVHALFLSNFMINGHVMLGRN